MTTATHEPESTRPVLHAVPDMEVDEAAPGKVGGQDADAATPVDLPADTPTPGLEQAWRPVIPAWARSRADLTSAVAFRAAHAGHTAAFHTVRAPIYAAKLAWRSPRGAWRLLSWASSWVTDAESAPLRIEAAARKDAHEYMRLVDRRNRQVRSRMVLLAPVAAGVLVALVTVLLLAGPAAAGALTAAGILTLGAFGAPDDKPLTSGAVVTHRVPLLTSKTIKQALAALSIAGLKDGSEVSFVAPITRDGPGYRADLDLPLGVTAAHIMSKRSELAGGLRRPVGAVWPEPDHTQHPGRLVLWVGDRDMARSEPTTWPLARAGSADLFKPIPIGLDQRGRRVLIELMFNNVLIGAMPRYGKTFLVRLLLLAAGLDVNTQLRVAELKGTGDLSPLERVAHHYVCGAGDDDIAAVMDSLRSLRAELDQRTKTIAKLDRRVCPENKVTPQLAARPDLGLAPIVMGIDECQMLFAHPDYKKEADALATDIVKRGPAVGIILILATQRPDKDSLPTGVSANAGLRFCFRVMGHQENDMILGTGAHKNGVRATTFTGKDKGIGLLVGNADDPEIVRPDFVDAPGADRVAERARAAREAAGTLTGRAVGDEDGPPAVDLLDDVAAVIRAGETKLWSETIATRLGQLRPDTYGRWESTALAAGLKPHGISTSQVWGRDGDGVERSRRGIVVDDVTRLVTARSRPRGGEAS